MVFLLLTACGFHVQGVGDETTIDGLGILCPPDLGDSWLDDTIDDALGTALTTVLNSVFDDISTDIEAKSTGPARTITLDSFDLVMTDPPSNPGNDNTLGFLDSLNVSVRLDGGSPELLLSAPDISDDETSLALHPEDLNLEPYLDQGFQAVIDFHIRECPREDIVFQPEYRAHVKL